MITPKESLKLFEKKIFLTEIPEEITFGFFKLESVGKFLYTKYIHNDETFYSYINNGKKPLSEAMTTHIKRIFSNGLSTYQEKVDKIINSVYDLTVEFSKENTDYKISPLDDTISDDLIKEALKALGVKAVNTHPDDTNIFIIDFYPDTDVAKYTAVWNHKYQKECLLRKAIEKVVYNLDPIEGVDTTERITTIVNFLMNLKDKYVSIERVTDETEKPKAVQVIKDILDTIIDKVAENTVSKEKIFPRIKLDEFPKEKFIGSEMDYNLIKHNEFYDQFFYFYRKGNIYTLDLYQIKEENGTHYVHRIVKYTIVASTQEELEKDLMELELYGYKIKDILSKTETENFTKSVEIVYQPNNENYHEDPVTENIKPKPEGNPEGGSSENHEGTHGEEKPNGNTSDNDTHVINKFATQVYYNYKENEAIKIGLDGKVSVTKIEKEKEENEKHTEGSEPK